MIDRTFYIYQHKKADTGEIFYVGKGTKTPKKSYGRAYSFENRNRIWSNTVKKHGLIVEIIKEFEVEEDAFVLECELISLYGRRDSGGVLCNLTDGGEGACGRPMSEAAKEKRRQHFKINGHPMTGRKGELHHRFGYRQTDEMKAYISSKLSGENHPLYGKHHSVEARERMSKAQTGGNSTRAKAVVDTTTGALFPSVRDAANAVGINRNTLKSKLNGIHTNNTTLRYA